MDEQPDLPQEITIKTKSETPASESVPIQPAEICLDVLFGIFCLVELVCWDVEIFRSDVTDLSLPPPCHHFHHLVRIPGM